MKKFNRFLFIFILIILIQSNLFLVYGVKDNIKEKAYDLGYEDGKREGLRHNENRPYYWALPNDNEIINRFFGEFEEDINVEDRLLIFRYYEYGFKDGYESTIKDEGEKDKATKEEKFNYPQKLGKTLGKIYGYKDFNKRKKSNWQKAMPTEKELEIMYDLERETKEYQITFLRLFKENFEKGYKEGFEKANLDPKMNSYKKGIEDGFEVGEIRGQYAAIIDITLGKTNLWMRHKVQDNIIIEEYGLKFQPENYRTAFIVAYWNGFMKSYSENHIKLQLDNNKIKTHVERVSIDGKTNIGIPDDDKFLVDIDAGTYYDNIIITIDSIPASYINPTSLRHTQASEIYGLKILNPVGTFDKNKNIVIKFKSYGNNARYGIYKYHFNKWIYIPSRQKEDYLIADININNINSLGNIYAVRIDNELPVFYDSRGHWAREEINTYVKREIIYGYPDGSFRPNNEITRREFVTMLSRLYDWYLPYDSSNIRKFRDYKEFGYGEKAISYATYYNIVNGYSDNTFRPNNPISYKEVEIIMTKVLNNKNFNWDYYAEKMLYEEGIRSKSIGNKNNKITRGEFVYMLHRLNEWQY